MNKTEKQVISFLQKRKSFWELASEQDDTIVNFIRTINKLYKNKIIECNGRHDGKISLAKKSSKFSRFSQKNFDMRCKKCEGKTITFDSEFKRIYKNFLMLTKDRPKPVEKFDQGFVRSYDTVARVAYMHEMADIDRDSNVLVIGDDDLVSIALALFGCNVTVIEIDERINDFINNVAEQENFPIKVFEYDVRNPLPTKLKKKFDCFFTDPVETINGIKLFLSRGAESLKENSFAYFGLTHLEAGLKKWYEIQKMLLKMNFIITDIIRDFHYYPETKEFRDFSWKKKVMERVNFPIGLPDCDWFRSSLVRLKAVGMAKPLIKGKMKISNFYSDEEILANPR